MQRKVLPSNLSSLSRLARDVCVNLNDVSLRMMRLLSNVYIASCTSHLLLMASHMAFSEKSDYLVVLHRPAKTEIENLV